MKQELITISSAVVVGALSRGLTGTMTETSSNTVKGVVNGVVAVGAGFLAVKVNGSDTKSSLLRGSAIGVSIAHGLELVKNIFSLEKNNSKAGEKIKQVIEISKTNNKEVIELEKQEELEYFSNKNKRL